MNTETPNTFLPEKFSSLFHFANLFISCWHCLSPFFHEEDYSNGGNIQSTSCFSFYAMCNKQFENNKTNVRPFFAVHYFCHEENNKNIRKCFALQHCNNSCICPNTIEIEMVSLFIHFNSCSIFLYCLRLYSSWQLNIFLRKFLICCYCWKIISFFFFFVLVSFIQRIEFKPTALSRLGQNMRAGEKENKRNSYFLFELCNWIEKCVCAFEQWTTNELELDSVKWNYLNF